MAAPFALTLLFAREPSSDRDRVGSKAKAYTGGVEGTVTERDRYPVTLLRRFKFHDHSWHHSPQIHQ